MPTASGRSRRLGGLALALAALVAVPSGSALAAASPPTVTIKVPAKVRPNRPYNIVLKVTYDKAALGAAPYLLSYLQFSGARCQPTVGAEYALGSSQVLADYIGAVPTSPFTRTDGWRAGTLTGARRVCAYLYPKRVKQRSRAKPLLMASRRFENI